MTQKNDKDPFSPQCRASPIGSIDAKHAQPSKLAIVVYSLLLAFLFVSVTLFCAVSIGLFKPMRVFSVCLLISVVALPLAAIVLVMLQGMLQKVAVYRHKTVGHYSAKTYLVGFSLLIAVGIVGVVNGVALFINNKLDRSPLIPYTMTVSSKFLSIGKHGRQHYYAVVDSPVKSSLSFALDNSEHLPVDVELYQRIKPGVTRVVLNLHDGFLGFPWLKTRTFIGPFAATSSVSPKMGQ